MKLYEKWHLSAPSWLTFRIKSQILLVIVFRRSTSEESADSIQNLKEEVSRRESEISGLNRKLERLVEEANQKTGNASEAYAKLNEMHQVRKPA